MADLTAQEMESLTQELRKRVAGEVCFDKMTKVLYSTDASIYEIEPLGVVIPRATDDVLATIEACRRYGVPILPRGAGTALSGQSVGRAVILDELNAELRPHGLWFPPDPSPSNRATLGGMMGNNSSGARSIIYGRTVEHVLMIEEFLVRLHDAGRLALPLTTAVKSVLLHGHCHQKALIGSSPSLQVLKMLPGAQVEEVDSGCCGMAGSFGYEKEHYDLSLAIGERRLFPAIRSTVDDCTIVAAGVSCRQQIAHGTGRRAKHLVEVLAEALP